MAAPHLARLDGFLGYRLGRRKVLERVLRSARDADRSVRAETVADFGSWSDAIWKAARPNYGMCLLRDAATLRKMYPREAAGFEKIKVFAEKRRSAGPSC